MESNAHEIAMGILSRIPDSVLDDELVWAIEVAKKALAFTIPEEISRRVQEYLQTGYYHGDEYDTISPEEEETINADESNESCDDDGNTGGIFSMANEQAVELLANIHDVFELSDEQYDALQLAICALMVTPTEEIHERLKNKIAEEQNNGI